MCKYKSAIVLRNGDLLHDPYTDSHEYLVSAYGLDDSKEPSINRFVRVEYYPEKLEDYVNPKKYKLKVDESEAPAWFEEIRESVIKELDGLIKRMILKDVKKKCLLSGCYILAGKTDISYCVNTRIFLMTDTSKVGEMWVTSKVGEMRETSKVGVMWGTSKVGVMRGTSKVGVMRETSQVGVMRETSQVGVMLETSQVGEMSNAKDKHILKDNRIAIS